jgi:hypothetical protein
MIWRGYLDYVYTTCGRCQRKVPIGECEWDDGILVCRVYNCKDVAINGAFEYRVAQECSKDRQELQPDPKLINPVDPASQIETISARAGGF